LQTYTFFLKIQEKLILGSSRIWAGLLRDKMAGISNYSILTFGSNTLVKNYEYF